MAALLLHIQALPKDNSRVFIVEEVSRLIPPMIFSIYHAPPIHNTHSHWTHGDQRHYSLVDCIMQYIKQQNVWLA